MEKALKWPNRVVMDEYMREGGQYMVGERYEDEGILHEHVGLCVRRPLQRQGFFNVM